MYGTEFRQTIPPKALDSDATHFLSLLSGSDLSANRGVTLLTGDADRSLTLQGNATLADWFDQALKIASSPTFAGLTMSAASKLMLNSAAQSVRATTPGDLQISAPDEIFLNAPEIWTSGHVFVGNAAPDKELRIYEGTNYRGFKAPALSNDLIWTLPNLDKRGVFRSDGAAVMSVGPAFIRPTEAVVFTDQFIGGDAVSGNIGELNWTLSTAGAGAGGAYAAAETSHVGIFELHTGTTASGYAVIHCGTAYTTMIGKEYFEAQIKLDNLSTLSQLYLIRIGLNDNTVGGSPNDGINLRYVNAGSTPNWYRETISNGSTTAVLSSTAVTTAWTNLAFQFNAFLNQVEFFVNGVSIGKNTTNIPLGRHLSPSVSIVKIIGTSSRKLKIDNYHLEIEK
jgi:hypothetical protein